MIIDGGILQDGLNTKILAKLIRRHEPLKGTYARLLGYYKGEHDIKDRRKTANSANTKVICNHAKYIVDMIVSYLVGSPVTYTASAGVDIEPLKEMYLAQDISILDSRIVKNMSIYGCAYELIYRDEEAEPKSVMLNPTDTFMVYDNTAQQKPLFAVNYYRKYDIDGICKGMRCFVYDEDYIYTYESDTDNAYNMQLAAVKPHYFRGIPIIEYINNDEMQGDFTQLISLIDAYNLLQSDRVNDKSQFVESFLFLVNVDVDSETVEKLKKEKILMAQDECGKAQWLSKIMTESDIKILRDDLKEDIHRFSMVPDLSDESFGSNLSGVAIKYKLLGFEQHIKNKERFFAKGLKARFKLYNSLLALKSRMAVVDVSKIDIVFTRNLPVNSLETSQMINNLRGIASTETLLEQLDFVSDAKEEKELLDKESADEYEERIRRTEGIAKGHGFSDFNRY